MPKFLIEVPHEPNPAACARAIQTFLDTGSQFLANADWGCKDGVHRAWLMVEMDSKEDARFVLPPSLRSEAKVIKLGKYTLRDVESLLQSHPNQ